MSQCAASVFSPAEAGRDLGCSASTVKRVAADLRIEPIRTIGGARLFTGEQVDKIRVERARRAVDAARQ